MATANITDQARGRMNAANAEMHKAGLDIAQAVRILRTAFNMTKDPARRLAVAAFHYSAQK